MAIIPVTQLQHQAESAVALRNDELRQAEEFERQRAAYNALRRSYGDIAGDPQTALQLQEHGFRGEMNPLKIDHQQLQNTGLADKNNFLRQSYPLQLEGLELGNEGARLGNEGQSIGNRGADAELREKALVDGARYVKRRVSEGADIAAAFDEVAPQLPVPPDQLAQLREALTSDPTQLDAFLENYGAEQQGGIETGVTPHFGVDEQGNPVPLQVTKDGRVVRSQMPEGVQFSPNPIVRDLGDREAMISPVTGELIGVFPKAGGPEKGQRPIVDDQGNVTGYENVEGSKMADEAKKKESAKADLSDNLEGLAFTYLKLDEMGAVVNPDDDTVPNIIRRLRSSYVGQLAEGALGTEAQSLRERINNIRPLLINTIRQASEMSARGLDSNRELDFYLQAATDPTKDLYSNLVAIEVLDQKYGLGSAVEKAVPKNVYRRIKEQASLDLKTMPIPDNAELERRADELGVDTFSDMSDDEFMKSSPFGE